MWLRPMHDGDHVYQVDGSSQVGEQYHSGDDDFSNMVEQSIMYHMCSLVFMWHTLW